MPGTVATFSYPWYILHYENLLDEDNYSDVIEFIEGVIKEMSHEFDLGDINIGPNSVSFEVDNFMPHYARLSAFR